MFWDQAHMDSHSSCYAEFSFALSRTLVHEYLSQCNFFCQGEHLPSTWNSWAVHLENDERKFNASRNSEHTKTLNTSKGDSEQCLLFRIVLFCANCVLQWPDSTEEVQQVPMCHPSWSALIWSAKHPPRILQEVSMPRFYTSRLGARGPDGQARCFVRLTRKWNQTAHDDSLMNAAKA